MAVESLSERTVRLGASVFHAVLLLVGAGARLVKGIALFIASWAGEVSDQCLETVTARANREGRIVGDRAIRGEEPRRAQPEEDRTSRREVRAESRNSHEGLVRRPRGLPIPHCESRIGGTWVVTEEGYVAPYFSAAIDSLSVFAWSPPPSLIPPAAYTFPFVASSPVSTIGPIPFIPQYRSFHPPVRRSLVSSLIEGSLS